MTTGVAGSVARDYNKQLTHYYRKTVNFNDAGIATGVQFGVLPAGAEILSVVVKVKTAFNAVTTNVLTAGTTAGSNADIVSAADVTEGTVGAYLAALTSGAALTFAADTPIFAQYTQTGTAATTGKAVIIVTYAVNNDL